MARQMKLNGRLAMVAGQIPACTTVADIGTDHAFIPIYAAENGLCIKAIAADLREGPLKMANANIARHGLAGVVETRLGSGLEPISEEECDVFVIAGMGGALIRDILAASPKKAERATVLLLQPNNATDVLRKWLAENGYEIMSEALARDAGKLYGMLSAKWTGVVRTGDDFDYYIGTMLLNSGDPLLPEYVRKRIKELDVVISGRRKSKKDRAPAIEIEAGLLPKEGKETSSYGISLLSRMSLEECMEIRERLNVFFK